MSEYRYSLQRAVGLIGDIAGRLCWVMLNPSTANEHDDDPTIRRVVRFTRDAGFTELIVVNLFAARSTDPAALASMDDPVGPNNDAHIDAAFDRSTRVVFAWGASASARDIAPLTSQRVSAVEQMAAGHGLKPHCLGMTSTGAPRHPLYVRADQPLIPYRNAA